jgi:uncharacterized protein YceK
VVVFVSELMRAKMRRGLLVWLVLLPFLAAVCGCGTMFNVLGPRRYPHLYGGVEFDYLTMKATMEMAWSPSKSEQPKGAQSKENLGDLAWLLAVLVAIDFPLSFVGDTLTLPDALFQSGFQGWDCGEDKDPDKPHSQSPPTAVDPEAANLPDTTPKSSRQE